MRPEVLILGGTTEGYALATALADHPRFAPYSSLAGRTSSPRLPRGDSRIGGFGGAEGLAAWLAQRGTRAVIDATHPFASRMGWNAATACAQLGLPLLRLERPSWCPGPGDCWNQVADWEAAVRCLAQQRAQRVLLALGRQDLAPFAALKGVWFLIRSVEPPEPMPPFAQAEILLARGPFSAEEERALLVGRGIDSIVCKNSGGSATDAKLTVARELGLRVVMRRRPPRPETPTVADVAAAVTWLEQTLPG